MSDLIAVAYPDKQTAETVRTRLMELVSEHVIELEDAVVVDRDEDGEGQAASALQSRGRRRCRRRAVGRADRAAVPRPAVRRRLSVRPRAVSRAR
jgi:hypothetical protein